MPGYNIPRKRFSPVMAHLVFRLLDTLSRVSPQVVGTEEIRFQEGSHETYRYTDVVFSSSVLFRTGWRQAEAQARNTTRPDLSPSTPRARVPPNQDQGTLPNKSLTRA